MSFLVAVVAALAAAFCYGVGSVAQAVATRRSEASTGLDPRLLFRLLHQWLYVCGLSLDILGFLASVVALHRLPLFFVQAAVTSSVGVTVLVGMKVLGLSVGRREVIALATLGVGLLLLALSARPETASTLSRAGQWAMLSGTAVVAVVGVVAGRARGTAGVTGLAMGAGLGFTGVGVAARALVIPHHLFHLVAEPLAWSIAGYGVLATLLFATALQRGALTAVVAITFAVETVAPAMVGLVFLGDRARPGLVPAAAVGFAFALAGTIALSGHAAGARAARP
jgi:drug/metabolite transporter (DMT)-like permease